MIPVESRIRNLSLRPPSESLDARITAMFSSAQEPTLLKPAAGSQQEVKSADRSSVLRTSKNPASICSGWIPVCASLLIGTVVGHWLQFSRPDERSGDSMSSSTAAAGEESQSGQSTTVNSPASGVGSVEIENQERSPVRSQIVESLWISPAAAAVAWEQQTGQIFNVVNHVNDRRFDMCRDCHRVGG